MALNIQQASASAAASTNSAGYIKPEYVLSPKDRVNQVVKILYDGGEGNLSVAILDYVHDSGSHNPETVAIRWNGSADNTLGFPSVRQYPVWFIVPEELASTIKFLAEQKFQFNLPFDKANSERFLGLFGNLFSTESLTKELKTRGYKLTLEM